MNSIKGKLIGLTTVDNLLAGWLIDNTDEVFEEQPEIDEARFIVDEVADGIGKALDGHIASLKAVSNIVNDYLKSEMDGGFTEFEALEDAIEILADTIKEMESKENGE